MSVSVGATIFVVALVLMRRHLMPRVVVVLMAIAGAMLGGLLYAVIDWILTTALGLADSVTELLFGRAIAAVAVIALTLLVVIDVLSRRGHPRKWTPWGALAIFPAIAIVIGPAMPSAIDSVVTAVGVQVVDLVAQVTEGR
jgi:hypothetical protein